jgi:hypothetical protein
MKKIKMIDITFDVRVDSGGKDPDSSSATLRQYHKLLWSKKLPNGKLFDLDDSKKDVYLYHRSELGEYFLSSDSIIHTYTRWKRMTHIIESIPRDKTTYFLNMAYTIGGFLIFPANKVNELQTINQERGVNKRINDRVDLTLECIRRYYNNEESPLFQTLQRYADFFELFTDFKGYVDFFLLQDLTDETYSEIKFFLPFDGFVDNPLPKDVDEYYRYMENNLLFLKQRNIRIDTYVTQ